MARSGSSFEAVRQLGPEGPAPVLLLCEHASNAFPDAFGSLGLDATARSSHAAWDPGALALAQRLSAAWDVPLVHSTVSRLIYDCNRPPDAADAIPTKSEVHEIPGNRGLSGAQRARRVDLVYRPFVAAVDAAIAAARPAALVTLHSFTPVYFGVRRTVEIGILHDSDVRLAEALLALDWDGYDVRGNDPYGPEHGVTHSLKLHAISRGLANVMIEVRNDLLADPRTREGVCALLERNLVRALDRLGIRVERAAQC